MPGRLPRIIRDDDPLAQAIAPPLDETPAEREERIRAEQHAKSISDAIDEEISRERQALKKAQKPVKILLLGQSESGKSTTLKNFQLLASPDAFNAERLSWRTVVQLNIVRSIRLILDAMSGLSDPSSVSPPRNGNNGVVPSPSSSPTASQESLSLDPPPPLSAELQHLKERLAPLGRVEETLLRRLNPTGKLGFEGDERGVPVGPTPDTTTGSVRRREIALNSTAWRGMMDRLLSRGDLGNGSLLPRRSFDVNDPCVAQICACAPDMIQLWNDPAVKDMLVRKKLRLEEVSGFYLDALDRVTQPNYVPTNEDILKARIKTLGVSEYRLTLKSTIGHDWRVYDVGGQRSLRAAWVPFMDDVNAVLFLAPISCFDQVLAEDPKVNRLEDSFLLWKSIVSNPLLKNANLVLLLNKCDILKTKLASGIRLADYLISYGERPNVFESASQYLKKKFALILRDHSVEPRGFYCHLTSVTDIEATKLLLIDVQDHIIRQSLKRSQLIA